jgi:hypothetical protein
MGKAVLIGVLCSIATTVASNLILEHFFPRSTAAKPVLKLPAPAKSKLATVGQPPPGALPPDPGDARQQANDAASAVLSTIQTIRDTVGAAYASPQFHPKLDVKLTALQTAANQVVNDNGADPAKTAKNIATFTTGLDATIALLDEITKRTYETDTAIQTSRQIESTLSDIRGSLP